MNITGDSHFLAALQLADSFFPTGMYAQSHGLEGMVTHGLVRDGKGIQEFLENLLSWSVIPSDGVALLNAHTHASQGDLQTVIAIDWHLHAMKLPAELRTASRQSGRRILDESAALLDAESAAPVHRPYQSQVVVQAAPGSSAVALGVTASAAFIPAPTTLMMYCHSLAVGVLGAAQRLLPITHTQAQQILRSLHTPIAKLSSEIQHRTWHNMTAFTPELDIAAMQHEFDDIRMFAS